MQVADNLLLTDNPGRIGIFDSGYGGLTILKSIVARLPQYDYLYLGDNARAPYGNRSFDIVLDFTSQAVMELFRRGCHLVILACNTASAKALRSIQTVMLPDVDPSRRVLGVIRPTVEQLRAISRTGHIGVLATSGTIKSGSYVMEVEKLFPEMTVTGQACPMWVPLIENNESNHEGADYFVKKYIDSIMSKDPEIDTLVLGCTHYPLMIEKIRKYTPVGVRVLPQGELVAESLAFYLQRHPEIERKCTKNGTIEYLSTENAEIFDYVSSLFLDKQISSEHISLCELLCNFQQQE